MHSQFANLWRHLLAEGVIDHRLCAALEEHYKSNWRSLGEILMDQGAVDVDRLGELIEAQMDDPTQRLGEIAVSKGLCTEDDIRAAVAAQRQVLVSTHQMLLTKARSTPSELFAGILSYIQDVEDLLTCPGPSTLP